MHWLRALALTTTLLASVAPRLSAQSGGPADRLCPAQGHRVGFRGGSSGYRLWPEAAWQAGQDTMPRPALYVTERLAGAYTVLRVMVIGAPRKYLDVGQMTLVAVDSASRAGWAARSLQRDAIARGDLAWPLMGQVTWKRQLDLGTMQAVSDFAPYTEAVRVRYAPARHEIMWQTGPFETLDAGTFYDVYGVTGAGGFSGGWSDGGFAITMFNTPHGRLGEPMGGYYCAVREE